MKILSFNVKNFMHSEQLEEVAAFVKKMDPDIVGFQEVDEGCARSKRVRQTETIARLAGYPYFAFGKNIGFQGGEYGNAIISKYPIRSVETVPYQTICPTDHSRSYMRTEMDVEGKTLCFYNTHLTLQKEGEAVEEVKELCARMSRDQYAVTVGDFNLSAETVAATAEPNLRVLNGGKGYDILYTFSTEDPSKSIDNILVTPNMEVIESAKTHRGTLSDHNPIWATVCFPKEG